MLVKLKTPHILLKKYKTLITKLQGNDKAEALYSLVMLTVDKMKDMIGVNAATVLALDVIKSCL